MDSTPSTGTQIADTTVPLEAVVLDARDLTHACTTITNVLAGTQAIIPIAQPHPSPNIPALMRAGEPVPGGTLIATTSGTTGTPKGAILNHHNLLASITATEHYTATHHNAQPGAWLLAIPAHHIAGIQVLARSLHAGYTPTAAKHLIEGTSFTAEGFAADTHHLRHTHPNADLYVSLVPTQLERLRSNPEGIEALTHYAMILVGGAAARTSTIEELRTLGINLVTTYGSSETSGGVIYDGQPLKGVNVSIENPDSNGVGRIVLSGPMVAAGYRNAAFGNIFPKHGTFITQDLGKLHPSNHLEVLGRADGAINSGGYKILPEAVENLLWAIYPHAHNICAVRLEDNEFGESIGAVVEWPDFLNSSAANELHRTPRGALFRNYTTETRNQLRSSAPRHLIPKHTIIVDSLPTIGPGKVDRDAVQQSLTTIISHIAEGETPAAP